MKLEDLQLRLDSFKYCFEQAYYEDAAGHLCDLLKIVAEKLGTSPPELLARCGISPLSDIEKEMQDRLQQTKQVFEGLFQQSQEQLHEIWKV